jgi:iron complex outermembrane recepter protein
MSLLVRRTRAGLHARTGAPSPDRSTHSVSKAIAVVTLATCVGTPAWGQPPTASATASAQSLGTTGGTEAAAPVGSQTFVVTGAGFATDITALPFGVSVVTEREIRESGVTSVNEAMTKLLGVPGRMDLSDGSNATLDLRGFGVTTDSNQVVIVDGVRLSEGDQSAPRLASLPIHTIERIEVLRGAGTVLYGEGAVGGVIVITTKAGRGAERRTGAEGYAAAGSHGLREVRASGTWAQGALSFDVSGQRRLSDGHRRNFDAAVSAASIGGQWAGEHTRIALHHAQDELHTGLPGELTVAELITDPRASKKPQDRGDVESRRTNLNIETRLAGWAVAIDLGRRERDTVADYVSSSWRGVYDVRADSAGLRAQHAARWLGVDHTVVVGLDAQQWRRSASWGTDSTQRNRAVYARDEVELSETTRLSVGLRSETVDKSDNAGSPALDDRLTGWELGVVQTLAEGVQVYGRQGNSYRLANADEYSFTLPAVALRPQTSYDVEIGTRVQQASGRFEARWYRSRLTDEIGYDASATPNPWGGDGANVNLAPTRRTGVEVEASRSLSERVTLRSAAAWREATFRGGANAGRKVPLVPRLSASAGADWRVAPGHTLGMMLSHVSSRPPDSDFANACRMPAATTLDLRYTYALARRAEFSLGVANATDKRYYTYATGCTGSVPTSVYPEPGRTFTASARVRF